MIMVGSSFVTVGGSFVEYSGPIVPPEPPVDHYFQLTNHGSSEAILYVTSGSSGQIFVNDVYIGKFSSGAQATFTIPARGIVKITGLTPRGNSYDSGTLTTDSSSNNFSIDQFDVSITNPSYMFCKFSGLRTIRSWNGAQNYTGLRDTFAFSSELTTIPTSWEGLENITELVGTFNSCALTEIPSTWSTLTSVENMGDVFNGCPITTIPSSWDFPSIRRMWGTFNTCRNITAIPNSWSGLENVTQMSNVFERCSGIVTGGNNNIEALSNVTNFNACFWGCSSWTGDGQAIYDYMSSKAIEVRKHTDTFAGCTNCVGWNEIPNTWGGGLN